MGKSSRWRVYSCDAWTVVDCGSQLREKERKEEKEEEGKNKEEEDKGHSGQ